MLKLVGKIIILDLTIALTGWKIPRPVVLMESVQLTQGINVYVDAFIARSTVDDLTISPDVLGIV